MASHSQVAHRWAQDEGKPIAGFNMFFERRERRPEDGGPIQTIFSHGKHFALASFQNDALGRRVVLANLSESRSVSTSKHQHKVSRAIPACYTVFDVPSPDPLYKRGGSQDLHPDNLAAIMQRAADFHAKSKRARADGNRPWLADKAAKELQQAFDYAEAFALPRPTADIEALAADIQRRADEQQEAYRKDLAERQAREKARVAALRIEQRGDFEAWQRGERERIPSAYKKDEFGGAYVRRMRRTPADGSDPRAAFYVLDTSQGAQVPWGHAVKVYRFAKLCRATETSWKRNGATIRVGHFQVDSIDVQGNMWAGCHYLAWPEMEALAIREGMADEPATTEAVHRPDHEPV